MFTSQTNQFNILYIEDDQLTREITATLLKRSSDNLFLAENGLDGFMKFKSNSIDLIITDLSMPKINGSDFIKMIRDINTKVPIIVLSVDMHSEILQDSINYGIQGYMQKPICLEKLQAHITTIKSKNDESSLSKEYEDITNTSAIISKINKHGIITYVNERFCQVTGFKKEELIGESYKQVTPKAESTHLFSTLLYSITKNKKVWTGTLKLKHKNGELSYLKTTIQPIEVNNKVEQFIALSIPINDVINPEEQLNDYLKQHEEVILLLVKIEEFKYLKNSFTKKITKKLQNLFAKELLKNMPKECNFLKIHLLDDGQFVFVKEYDKFIEPTHLTQTIQRFQKKVNQQKIKIGIVDYTLSIICSLSYGTEALENAKIGLSKILESKEDFILASNFLEEATRQSNAKLNKFNMLREAIDSYNIISHFQPIINNKTLKIEKYESLVRLIDQDKKIISPNHFLEIAKEGNYYHKITSIVLRNSFRALFYTDIEISINLSSLDLENERTKSDLFVLLKKYQTETHRITIELVEDEEIKNKQEIQEFIQEVKKYGVKIALDDFGKGFSNFSRIQSYQPDYIKIDGSLISNIETDKLSQDLVQLIVFFAKKQNIKTIAEFVESEGIYNILKNLGVDYSQGHYFSKAGLLKDIIPSTY